MGFKIKYDSSEVDRSKQDFIPPKPGVYRMKIAEVKMGKTKDDTPMLTFVVRMDDDRKEAKKSKGFGFWDNVVMSESSAWKLDQYLTAIGIDTLKKKKGTIDSDTFIGKELMGRVKNETYEGELRPKLAAVFPIPDDEDFDDDDDDDDDEDEDETPAKKSSSKSKSKSKAKDDDDDDDDDDDEDDEDDDDDDDEDDDDEDDDDDDDEDDDDEDDDEPAPPKKSSKSKAKEEPPAKSKSKGKSKKPDYGDMDEDDLRAECKKRGLASKGTKSALIARLRANDEDPFSD